LEDGVEAKETNYFYHFDVPLFSFSSYKNFSRSNRFDQGFEMSSRESLAIKQT
jgi:hypothetical protein